MKLDAAHAAPDSWECRTIGEACERITSGGTPSRREPSFYEGGSVPWVKTKELNDGVIFATEELITERALASSSAKLLPAGTILLAMYGATVGMLGVLGKPMACNQACCALIPSADTDRDYLYYQLLAHREQLQGLATGAAQQNLSGAQIKQLVLPFPALDEQKSIGKMLRILDDRITLLRETNATLEAIAQALFKSWFVDFDPVRAKMEGRTPEGMDEATAALFPDGFETSELGEVPRGWQVRPLDSVANYLNGLALQKFPPTGSDDLPVIKIAQLRKGDAVGADLASRAIKPDYVVQNGDVLFSWSGSLEVEIWCGGEGALNQHLFKVTSSQYPKWFYYLWTRHHLDNFRQIAASKATTMGHIQRSHLSAAKVVVGSDAVLDSANGILSPLIDRIVSNALQAQTLSTLRDTLLPRLISGQLRLDENVGAINA
ncbi:restriction endonuclease subunit S [Simplicispira hankyongi]|uniref:Restriction endonuclease subunit S n=1 Tax=Simplicispira hankyongi TaxID=2315688 RepID=A0A398C7C4_9BURK|nr:restriction endonuclease subunit S [Simplicispira hankyongi]RID97391.1 restriction endonuclease subunit S [Simplicispira hankyongi]